MSTTLNRPTTENWAPWSQDYPRTGQVPVYTVPPQPGTLSNLDRTILLAAHAMIALVTMAIVPVLQVTPSARVFIDLGVLAYLATPAIIMAAFRTPHRTWWVVAAPLISAFYLWLPSAVAGSVYADAHILAITALTVFAPVLNVVAPLMMIAQSDARPWPLAAYGIAAIAAPGIVYAALSYPLIQPLAWVN